MEKKVRRPPSLQELSLKAVIRRYVSVTHVVELMRFFKQIDWMIEQGPALKGLCTKFLQQTYGAIEKKHSYQELEEILGNDVLSKLDKESKEIRAGIEKAKIKGRVVERQSYMPPRTLSTPPLGRSVSGKNVYPYGHLRTGLQWPTDVDASSREEHLDDTEFQCIFRVSYDVYRTYPKWKKIQLKKECDLF
eukprot:g4033.t1